MNLALLKMTQGSSWPEMKAFQNTRKAPGALSTSRAACAALRLETRLRITRVDAANNTASEAVAMIQLRTGWPRSGVASQCDSAPFVACNLAWRGARRWNERT